MCVCVRVCVRVRLHAICIVVMRAPRMMECTTVGCACTSVSVACARAASFSSLFPVLMMMLIICSAYFHPPQAHQRAHTCTHVQHHCCSSRHGSICLGINYGSCEKEKDAERRRVRVPDRIRC